MIYQDINSSVQEKEQNIGEIFNIFNKQRNTNQGLRCHFPPMKCILSTPPKYILKYHVFCVGDGVKQKTFSVICQNYNE